MTESHLPEVLLLDLYENAPCGFHSVDASGTFVFVNNTELRWLGYQREEVIARMRLADVVAPDCRQLFAESWARLIETGVVRDLEINLVRKDGSVLPVLLSATAIVDGNGTFLLCRSILYDLTDRRRAERLASRDEARYRLLFESSMDGIVMTRPDGTVVDANESACSIFGRTREEILRTPREDLLDTSDPTLPALLAERRRTGKLHTELMARRPDGSLFPIETTSAVVHDGDGNEVNFIILRDISARKDAEVERERLITRLQEALNEIKVLTGVLPICTCCKKVRDENGSWQVIEVYIRDRSEAEFSHSLCPDCFKKVYPDYVKR